MPNLLARHSIHYAAATIVAAVVVPGGTAILTRILAPADYGIYSIAYTAATQAGILCSQWIVQSTTRYLPGSPRDQRQTITSAIGVLTIGASLVFALAVLALSPASPTRFAGGRLVWIAAAFAGVIAILFNPLLAVLQASLMSRRFGIVRTVNVILGYGGAIGLCFLWHKNAVSVIVGFAFGSFIAVLVAWRLSEMPSLSELLNRIRSSRSTMKRLALYGAPITLWFVGATVIAMSDRYVIAAFLGTASAGIYASYYLLVSGSINLVCSPIITAAHPLLMKAWSEGDKTNAGNLLGKATELITLGSVCLAMIAGLFSRELASLLLPPAYQKGHILIPLFLLAVGLWQAGSYVHKPLEFAEKTLALGLTALSVACASILINIIVVPRFGYLAAGWTMLGSSLAYVVLATIQSRRILIASVHWGMLITKIAGVLVVGSALYSLKEWLSRFGGTVLSVSVTIALLGIIIASLAYHFKIYNKFRYAN
jgi:O-antigen/teichoic acid export membrane protein